jgi:AcrR family transcriptional regulator
VCRMPRAGLTTDVVVERAAELLERAPGAELTLAAVADSLGVRAPSLYKHVDGLPGLRRGIMLRAKRSLGDALAKATIGRSGAEAVRGISVAYRKWALANPAQYPLTIAAAIEGDAEDAAAGETALRVIYAVLAGYGLEGEDAVDATRFLRATIHGFVSLETSGAFRLPVSVETSYERVVESLVAGLEAWGR